MPMNDQKSEKKGGTGLTVVLAVIMGAELVVTGFLRPGFLIPKKVLPADPSAADNVAYDSSTPPVSDDPVIGQNTLRPDQGTSLAGTLGHDWEPAGGDASDYQVIGNRSAETVASGILTEDNLTVKSSDGASMTIDPCFLEKDTSAEIRKVPGTVDYRIGDATVPLTMYEFHADGISDDTYMTLEIPFDQSEGGAVGAGYYDASTGTLWPVPSTYDESGKVIRITATHLSGYCGFPIDHAGTNKAMLGYMSYTEGYDRLVGDGNSDLLQDMQILEKGVNGGSSWAVADDVVNDLGEMATPADLTISSLGVIGDIESGLTRANGAGSTIVKNAHGTVGEIMNTMWGKSGSWGTCKRYGGSATVVEIEDKLKSTYPTDTIESLGKAMNVMNTSIAAYKIFEHARKGDTKAAVWESVKLTMDKVVQAVAKRMGSSALNVYLIGVAMVAYGLDTIYSEALEGRKMVYMKAYTRYYQSRDTDGGYRSGAKWRTVLTQIMKSGGGVKEIEAELDRYVNEFWVKADQFGPEYLANVMTDDEKIAWGAAGQAGLNDEIKKEISDSFKAELKPLIENVLYVMNEKNQTQVLENYMAQYESLCRKFNQMITFKVIDGGKEEGKDSDYAGCVVRFKDLKGKVESTNGWETALNQDGQGEIRVTLLAHMLANAGTTVEVVKVEDDTETVIHEQSFQIRMPETRIILDFPESTGAEWINGYWGPDKGEGDAVFYYEIKGDQLIQKFDLSSGNGIGDWYDERKAPYTYDSKTKTITTRLIKDLPETRYTCIDDDHLMVDSDYVDKDLGEVFPEYFHRVK